jgi:hypothetical protein
VVTEAEHEGIRETEDRSWTFALPDVGRSPSTPEVDRAAAFRTLAFLEDNRAVGPLTAMVEDVQLSEPVREAASRALVGFDDTTKPSSDRQRSEAHPDRAAATGRAPPGHRAPPCRDPERRPLPSVAVVLPGRHARQPRVKVGKG